MRIIVIKKIKLLKQKKKKKNLWDLGSEYKLLATYLVVLCRCGILEEWSVVTSSSTASIKISRLRGLPTERWSFKLSIFPRTEPSSHCPCVFRMSKMVIGSPWSRVVSSHWNQYSHCWGMAMFVTSFTMILSVFSVGEVHSAQCRWSVHRGVVILTL